MSEKPVAPGRDAWLDSEFARRWAAEDQLADLLVLPRRISAVLAGAAGAVQDVVDIGAGPGAFLEVFLDAIPSARGTWVDVSPEMERIARERLGRFGDRVDYRIGDMTDLDLGVPEAMDVAVTSRASHHLSAAELAVFYGGLRRRLRPGGWLFNLDHVLMPGEWDSRLRAARKAALGERPRTSSHHHDAPLPTLEEHLDALRTAGMTDIVMPWRAFITVLIAARG